jgi:hypothetical protein
MSKPRKPKRALPAKTDTAREQYDAYLWLKTELQKADAWDAAARMRELAAKTFSEPLKGFCIKALMEYDLKLRLLNAGGPADSSIHISIAAWAGSPGSDGPKAIEAQPVDVTRNDPGLEAHSHAASIPTPRPTEPACQIYEMERGADGLGHAVRMRQEPPPRDDDRWETLIDNATGMPIKVRVHG